MGPRVCIGKRFGYTEVHAIAAALLRRFTLELPGGFEPRIRQAPTLSVAELPVRLSRQVNVDSLAQTEEERLDIAALTDQQRAVWRSGDYDEIAPTIEAASQELVSRIGIAEGQDILDVACGPATRRSPRRASGARVTGLDLTPELLEIARERAASEGVEIELRGG